MAEKEYIEREEAIKAMDELGERYGITVGNNFKAIIRNIPATDVAPVRHGHWVSMGDCGVTRCSCCGWSIEECIEDKYCRECGARMDGE